MDKSRTAAASVIIPLILLPSATLCSHTSDSTDHMLPPEYDHSSDRNDTKTYSKNSILGTLLSRAMMPSVTAESSDGKYFMSTRTKCLSSAKGCWSMNFAFNCSIDSCRVTPVGISGWIGQFEENQHYIFPNNSTNSQYASESAAEIYDCDERFAFKKTANNKTDVPQTTFLDDGLGDKFKTGSITSENDRNESFLSAFPAGTLVDSNRRETTSLDSELNVLQRQETSQTIRSVSLGGPHNTFDASHVAVKATTETNGETENGVAKSSRKLNQPPKMEPQGKDNSKRLGSPNYAGDQVSVVPDMSFSHNFAQFPSLLRPQGEPSHLGSLPTIRPPSMSIGESPAALDDWLTRVRLPDGLFPQLDGQILEEQEMLEADQTAALVEHLLQVRDNVQRSKYTSQLRGLNSNPDVGVNIVDSISSLAKMTRRFDPKSERSDIPNMLDNAVANLRQSPDSVDNSFEGNMRSREPPTSSDWLPWLPMDKVAGTFPQWLSEAMIGPYAILFQNLAEVAKEGLIRMQLMFDAIAVEPIPVTSEELGTFTDKIAQAFRSSLAGDEADALKAIAVTITQMPAFLPESESNKDTSGPLNDLNGNINESAVPNTHSNSLLNIFDQLVNKMTRYPRQLKAELSAEDAVGGTHLPLRDELMGKTFQFKSKTSSENLPWLPLDSVVAQLPGFFTDKLGKPGELVRKVAEVWLGGAETMDKATSKVLDPLLSVAGGEQKKKAEAKNMIKTDRPSVSHPQRHSTGPNYDWYGRTDDSQRTNGGSQNDMYGRSSYHSSGSRSGNDRGNDMFDRPSYTNRDGRNSYGAPYGHHNGQPSSSSSWKSSRDYEDEDDGRVPTSYWNQRAAEEDEDDYRVNQGRRYLSDYYGKAASSGRRDLSGVGGSFDSTPSSTGLSLNEDAMSGLLNLREYPRDISALWQAFIGVSEAPFAFNQATLDVVNSVPWLMESIVNVKRRETPKPKGHGHTPSKTELELANRRHMKSLNPQSLLPKWMQFSAAESPNLIVPIGTEERFQYQIPLTKNNAPLRQTPSTDFLSRDNVVPQSTTLLPGKFDDDIHAMRYYSGPELLLLTLLNPGGVQSSSNFVSSTPHPPFISQAPDRLTSSVSEEINQMMMLHNHHVIQAAANGHISPPFGMYDSTHHHRTQQANRLFSESITPPLISTRTDDKAQFGHNGHVCTGFNCFSTPYPTVRRPEHVKTMINGLSPPVQTDKMMTGFIESLFNMVADSAQNIESNAPRVSDLHGAGGLSATWEKYLKDVNQAPSLITDSSIGDRMKSWFREQAANLIRDMSKEIIQPPKKIEERHGAGGSDDDDDDENTSDISENHRTDARPRGYESSSDNDRFHSRYDDRYADRHDDRYGDRYNDRHSGRSDGRYSDRYNRPRESYRQRFSSTFRDA